MDKSKIPFYKKWWFYLIVVFLVVGSIGSLIESDEKKPNATTESTEQSSEQAQHSFNSNEGLTEYIESKGNTFNLLDVNGVYVEDGNNTVVITLDAKDKGMDSALNQIVMMVKHLHDADLSDFKEIGISVKADMADGSKGFAIKSAFDVKTIESDKVKTFRTKNIHEHATSWWQLDK